MRCYVLCGISRPVLDEIVRRNIRTIELRSAHNIATAMKVELGDCIFLTPSKTHDLGRGVGGVIAEVSGKEVLHQSIFYSSPQYIEESEMAVVRLRVTPRGVGRIVNLRYSGSLLDAIEAEIVEISYFDAR
jgi:hypothetical protein